ncbi:MAG: DUF4118 domain-containing protein [Rickettsiales bacterium]|nr:DUF4118 domain-containing protein [Rickettsiales bacterium]
MLKNFPYAPLKNYLGAIVAVTLCSLFGKVFDNFFVPIDQIMIYLIGAVLVASKFGRASSVLFSILSVTTFNFFFIEPIYSLNVINKTYWLTFAVMLITSLFISGQAAKLASQAFISRKREQDIKKFYDLTKNLASIREHKKIAEISAEKIAEVFNANVSIWLTHHNSSGINLEAIAGNLNDKSSNDQEQIIALWCANNAKTAGMQTDNFINSLGFYLPLMVMNKVIGVMAIYPKNQKKIFTHDEKSSSEIFASLISSSLERAIIAAEIEQTKIKSETEKLRNILLSSVSHDLRTPLSSIVGASESIVSNFEKLKKSSIINLAKSINSESIRLSKIVKNLLDVTKIESGNLKPNKQPYYIQEVIGSAILRMQETLQNHQINVVCDDNLPMILIDGVLIEQVITNLLENAAKYTPIGSKINITVKKLINELLIEIEDNGPGISQNNNFTDRKDGYGLGLIICRGILKAHNSMLEISSSKSSSGAHFSFILSDLILEPVFKPN